MPKSSLAVLALRILLVLLFALITVFQVLSMPGQFRHMAQEDPDSAHLRWPFTVIAILVLLCVQVVIVCTWKLLTMVREDRIFSDRSFVWVDTIVGAIGVAWVLFAGVFVYVGVTADDPGAPMLLSLVLLFGAVVGMLMLVMRALLRQATALRTDMEAVI